MTTLSALRRTIRRPGSRPDEELHCQLCSAPVPELHRHMLDEHNGELLCACRACTVLFQREAAGRGHYRLVPDRRRRLPPLPLGGLGVPVGLAFFTIDADGAVTAHYPSPMGATTSEVDAENWQAVLRDCPQLSELAPMVEALLVNTTRDAREHWVVPIDDCYRLVAVIRREWRGLSGGSTVWPAVDAFFAELNESPYTAR
ncbi:hypothetical protein H7K24_10215 [Mycobacterium fragae]|jgi:hypothetical protein|uniref:Uncharacterized protein n=1 Tax=Mycobacterium fragae TaxID=1260918 RepID=A0A1X1UWV8_9MYCO|nr:DUF5947 family protein [Mycobacterium fragae]MCV7400530.1 hypothetical protein [Mycobacterium fragae]ORV61287.1 hypothetical protein AWC06_13075 [Mycobacterium fragae]